MRAIRIFRILKLIICDDIPNSGKSVFAQQYCVITSHWGWSDANNFKQYMLK